MRKYSIALMLAIGVILVSAIPAQAGCGRGLFGRIFARSQARQGFSYQYRSESFSQSFSGGSCYSSQPQYGVPFATPQAIPTPQTPLPVPQAPAKAMPCPAGVCPVSYSQPAAKPQATFAQSYSYGIAEINNLRARYGLRALLFSQQMYNDAMINNQQQLLRGMGHWFMGRARRQNSGMSQVSASQAVRDWIGSPGHLSALLDPSIQFAAVAGSGGYWTFSAF